MAAKIQMTPMKASSPLRKGARPLALFLCAVVSFLTVVFSGGVAVGRWYSTEAVEYSPTLQAIDEENVVLAPAPQTELTYHSALTKPRPTALPLAVATAEKKVTLSKPEIAKTVAPKKAEAVDSKKAEAEKVAAVDSKKAEAEKVAAVDSKKAEPVKEAKKSESRKIAETKKPEPMKEAKAELATKKATATTVEAKKTETTKLVVADAKKSETELKTDNSKTYTLHFGSFPSNKEASNIALKVNKAGQNARVIDLGGSKFQVRLGKFSSLDEAKKAKEGIVAKTGISPVIGTL